MNTDQIATVAPSAVSIIDVHTNLDADRLRMSLDSPGQDETVSGFWLPIEGWLMTTSGERADIRISDRWSDLLRIGRKVPRPDVTAAFPDIPETGMAGFSVALGTIRLPEKFHIWLSAVIGTDSIRFALIRGTRRRLTAPEPPVLQPLPVTTLGRTGSTLLMTLLSSHPEIAAFRPASNDARPLEYALAAATQLAAPSSRIGLLRARGAGGDDWMGRAPLPVSELRALDPAVRESLFDDSIQDLLAGALEAATRQVRRLAEREGKPRVRYAAEKASPSYVPRLLTELCSGTREVFLVRDFRDVLASILAFNQKRGYDAFGRESTGSELEFVERFGDDVDGLARAWMERNGGGHLVRYEELIAEPDRILAGLFDYLQLDCSAAQLAEIRRRAATALAPISAQHQTSATTEASSGRWRRDLPLELMEACTTRLRQSCDVFGYE